MKIKNSIVYIYKIDFGQFVDSQSERATRKVMRSIENDLLQVYGICSSWMSTLMATISIDEE